MIGVVRGGRVIAIEVKRPGENPTPQQRAWLIACYRWGGFAAVVRSVDDAMAALAASERGAGLEWNEQ